MQTLHQYLVRQILAALALSVVVFTFVLLVGNLLKEILGLLVTGHAQFGLVVEAIGLLMPFLWVYALPMGLLTATLLVFGRFSADQELTAARAGGISLVSLIAPVLLISLICCAVSVWINLYLGPKSRAAYMQLIDKVKYEMVGGQLPEGTFIHDFPGYLCYVGKNRNGELQDVLILNFGADTNSPFAPMISSPRGRLEWDLPHQRLNLWLTNAVSTQRVGSHDRYGSAKTSTFSLDLPAATRQVYHPRISDMTYAELRVEMRAVENLVGTAPAKTNTLAGLRDQMRRLQQQKDDLTLPVRVEMNRRFAFSFASFGFALVGIPLGIRAHRRETNLGIVIALGLAAVYYSGILLGISLSARPEFCPELMVWLPNFGFQTAGAVLLWRANRGF